MDYQHPGRSRASANIGDHVQTLASLGHLVRHQDLSFQGPQDLVDLVTQLRGRVRPETRRNGLAASVQVMAVDRDASMYNEVPEDTWTLAFGWYMHALFGVRYGFPFHKNLQPIFVSFHCNKRGLLTPEAIEYLRAHGPIGCRDWTTVDILLSVDVPAFFSGCLTTTVNTVFPDLVGAFPATAPIAYVDSPDDAPPGAVTYKHSSDAVRFRSFTGNMFEAVDLLETYRRDHSALVTSRLHCYLPMRSIGAKVDFRPKNRSDIRFAGLIDITDDQFDAIRSGINDRLEKVFAAIMDGGPRDEVYGLWRELCAHDVELARARRAAAPGGGCDRRRMSATRSSERSRAAGPAGRRARPTPCDVAIRVDREPIAAAQRPGRVPRPAGQSSAAHLAARRLGRRSRSGRGRPACRRQHPHGDPHQRPRRRPPRAELGRAQPVPVRFRGADASRVAARRRPGRPAAACRAGRGGCRRAGGHRSRGSGARCTGRCREHRRRAASV